MLSGYFEHADAARDEFEPRGSDICPECGSGHTHHRYGGGFKWYDEPEWWSILWHCMECFARWTTRTYQNPWREQ